MIEAPLAHSAQLDCGHRPQIADIQHNLTPKNLTEQHHSRTGYHDGRRLYDDTVIRANAADSPRKTPKQNGETEHGQNAAQRIF